MAIREQANTMTRVMLVLVFALTAVFARADSGQWTVGQTNNERLLRLTAPSETVNPPQIGDLVEIPLYGKPGDLTKRGRVVEAGETADTRWVLVRFDTPLGAAEGIDRRRLASIVRDRRTDGEVRAASASETSSRAMESREPSSPSERSPSRFYQVTVRTSVQGSIPVSRRDLERLVVAALQRAGANSGRVGFVDMDSERTRKTLEEVQYGGDYDTRFGQSLRRGNFIQPTDRLELSFVIHRNVRQRTDRVRVLGETGKLRHVTETVNVQMMGTVTGLNTNTIRYGIDPVAVDKTATMDQLMDYSQKRDKPLLMGLFLRILVPTESRGAGTRDASTSREYALTFSALQEAADKFVARLESSAPSPGEQTDDDPPKPSGLQYDSISTDRSTVFLVGAIQSINVGDRVVIPVRRIRSRSQLGQAETETGEVVEVGRRRASIRLISPSTRKDKPLSSYYAVDVYRPIEVL